MYTSWQTSCVCATCTCDDLTSFPQEVFPIYYGQQYEATLHSLVWKFISKLDHLLPVPDIKQVCTILNIKKKTTFTSIFPRWSFILLSSTALVDTCSWKCLKIMYTIISKQILHNGIWLPTVSQIVVKEPGNYKSYWVNMVMLLPPQYMFIIYLHFSDCRVAQHCPLCHGRMWTIGFGTRSAQGTDARPPATVRKHKQM